MTTKPRIISVAVYKGGTGKTTTAVHVAHALSLYDKRVLIIDTDTQNQVASFLGVECKHNLKDVILDSIDFDDAIVEARENLWVLPGGPELNDLNRYIASKDWGGEHTLKEALGEKLTDFDYVIIDTSPSRTSILISTLFLANELLIPFKTEPASEHGLYEFVREVGQIQKKHPIEIKYILPTIVDGRVKLSAEMHDKLKRFGEDRVCEPIRITTRFAEAVKLGRTIFEHSPKHKRARDYEVLTERILADE